MKYPDFFDAIEPIALKDELCSALGAIENGEYEISYLEVVKAAGHSCPTVAGAYIITQEALKILYPNERALRGAIEVEFEESLQEGVAGVVANVITHITGATDRSGFKGLQGQFARHSLMHFGVEMDASARFTRVDTRRSVAVTYNPSAVLPNPKMKEIMLKMRDGDITQAEQKEFGSMWQERVERIFNNRESVVLVEEL